MAVNVTDVPAQMVLALAAITIVGVRFGFTTIGMLLLVAVAEVTHVALDVSTQVITSPLLIVEDINVDEFVPAFTPFIFHW